MSAKTIYTEYCFYVYAYLRRDGTPYYIGKGKGRRYAERHSVKLPPDPSRIVFLEKNLSEIGALALERRMIRWYGRKDLGTGILRNMTDGGDGTCGVIKVISDEHRKKLSEAKRGKPSKRKGCKFSEEHRKKLSISKRGKSNHRKGCKFSEEHRKKLSEVTRKNSLGKKWWNDGSTNKFSYECPGEGWFPGMLKRKDPTFC